MSKKLTTEQFIERSRKIHGDKFDYSKAVYINSSTPVTIICPIHGEFKKLSGNHISGGKEGCPSCINKKRRTNDEFEYQLKQQWPNYKFDHIPSTVDQKIEVECTIHNQRWNTTAKSLFKHLTGCKQCVIDRKRANCLANYGTTHHKQKDKTTENIALSKNKQWLIEQHHVNKRTIVDIAKQLGYVPTQIYDNFAELNIDVINYDHTISLAEKELVEILSKYTEVKQSDRTIIAPLELDIVLPQLNIAIEYCGLYWHSSQFRHPMYHYQKYIACKNKQYRLITIFEDEWINKRNIVISKLLQIIQCSTDRKVGARQCNIVTVKRDDKTKFFNQTHIQGPGPGTVTYGLVDKNNIYVAMITIAKMPGDHVWNIVRYATSCNVQGGFSKLLKHIKICHQCKTIITFADLRWSNGDLYLKNQFTIGGFVKPDYSYGYNLQRFHKFNFRHGAGLQRVLGDKYDRSKSESENMANSKYTKIYDCGKLKFIHDCTI